MAILTYIIIADFRTISNSIAENLNHFLHMSLIQERWKGFSDSVRIVRIIGEMRTRNPVHMF